MQRRCTCITYSVEERQQGSFDGFSVYVSKSDVSTPQDIGDSALCYKDGPQIPPLNLQSRVQNMDVMSSFIMNDWTK